MKNIKKILYSLILLLVLLGSCQETYDPEGLSSDKKIVVIEGRFDNTSDYINVSVVYATAFNDNSSTAIRKARVTLSDNNGNTYVLKEEGSLGNYRIKSSEVIINDYCTYYIRVETTEGGIYESEPQAFPGEFEITNIEPTIGEKAFIMQSIYGDFYSSTFQGLYLTISAQSTNSERRYIRFNNRVVYQSSYSTVEPMSPNPIVTRCVENSALSSMPVVEATYSRSGIQLIDKKEIGFLKYAVDFSTLTENTSARTPSGWVVIVNAYSMSGATYDYYKKVEKQVTAENKMFDPIPSQIIGNFKCVSNPDELVLGIFEVSRNIQKVYAFLWNAGGKKFKKIEIEDYHAPAYSHCSDSIPTYDWVTFY